MNKFNEAASSNEVRANGCRPLGGGTAGGGGGDESPVSRVWPGPLTEEEVLAMCHS